MHKDIKTNKCWISIGIAKQLALSIIVSKYTFSIDVGPFYLVVEYYG